MSADTAQPVPARITMALDARDLYGPDVDRACGTWEGNPSGDVDDWEAGLAVPTSDQIERLAALCELPTRFFYEPVDQAEADSVVFVCGRSGPRGGGRRICHRIATEPRPGPVPTDRQGTLF